MQSSMVVAGMYAVSEPRENILTRRANQRHYSIIEQFAKRPWPCPTTGSSSAIAGKKSLPAIEVAPARHSEGSPESEDGLEPAGTPWSSGHQRESPLVKTSKARATGAFTRTDLRTGAMTMGAFIQQLLSGFSASCLNAANASSQKVSSQSRNSISPSRRSE